MSSQAPSSARPLRIGNASGFYGDRFSAMREMLEGGPLDVLTGDYLAELTMLILGRDRLKDPNLGYAKTFVRQMETCLGLALDKRVKIVVNAGGLAPARLAEALRAVSTKLGLSAKIAHVEGDDLVARADELGLGMPLTANAYLGAFGIAECLRSGADVVVTGRVTDASLVVGPCAAHFGWRRDEWDKLAGATVVGHVLECGTQATGGNYSFFEGIDLLHPGFPLAEVYEDGSAIVTLHEGHGGEVSVGTVTAQLLYEIGGPRYASPDVTTRFDAIVLTEEGKNRVRVSGAKGEPPPPTTKVCLNHLGGYRNDVTFVLTGLDIEKKAELVKRQVEASLEKRPAGLEWTLARTDHEDATTQQAAAALLRLSVRDQDPRVVGRAVSGTAIEIALGSYPGFTLTAPPGDGTPFGVYTPAYVPQEKVPHVAVLADGTRVDIAPVTETLALEDVPPAPGATSSAATPSSGERTRLPLGRLFGARSGDKGGHANLGVWARSEAAFAFLRDTLTVEKLRELLPETAKLTVTRYEFPRLLAVNFLIEDILGQGVSASTRFDPQAKALGEWLRSRTIDVPSDLVRSELK